jgi:hypothetical protein
MTPPTGLAARTNRAGNAPYLGGALSMNDFAEQLNTQNEMLDGLKNTMVQTMSELRELMDNAPHEVLSEMARRMRDQLQQGGMLEIEDRLMQLLERKDTLLKGVFGENVWDEIRKEMDKQERIEARENQIGNARQDANESEQQRAEEIRAERERLALIEAENDNTPSSEHPGMSVGEVLRGLRIINENLSVYSQRAVDKGLIKPEERAAFEQYMRDKYWLEQQRALQRAGLPNELDTPEGRARTRAIEATEHQSPHYRVAGDDILRQTQARDMNANARATIANSAARIHAGANALSADVPTSAHTPSAEPVEKLNNNTRHVSVAGSIEGNVTNVNQTRLTGVYNTASLGLEINETRTGFSAAARQTIENQSGALQMGLNI